MAWSSKESKQKYFDKIYENAELVECACGCGTIIKNKDKYGRDKLYENGHNNRKYEDKKQYRREWRERNKEKIKETRASEEYKQKKAARGHKNKIEAIKYSGSVCANCGIKYDGTNGIIFQHHHIDPSIKDFNISRKMCNSFSEEVKAELDKCILLCANCHFMLHNDHF